MQLQRTNGYGDTFGYDAKGQLTGIGYEVPSPASGGSGLHAGSFAYDAMGNLTMEKMTWEELPVVINH